jgi:hypothetical protein
LAESEAVGRICERVDFLHRVGFLSASSEYRTARVVLQDTEHPELSWLMYGSGEDFKDVSPVCERLLYPYWQQKNCFDWPESAAQLLAVLMLQRLMGTSNKLCALLYSSDKISVFGLETEQSAESNGWGLLDSEPTETKARAVIAGFLRTHADAYLEYLDLWRERLLAAHVDIDRLVLWDALVDDLVENVFRRCAYRNVERWGWPVRVGDHVMFRLGSKLRPGVALDGMHHDELHSKLDRKLVYTLYRSVKPFEHVRDTLALVHQLCDVMRVRADDVRPMTNDERAKFGPDEQLEALGTMRRANLSAFFLGDIVAVYEEDVHDEHPHTHDYNFDQDVFEARAPVDVGLVVGTDWGWRTVYLWKAKAARSVQCSKLFWLPDDKHGRALTVLTELLDELAPRAILKQNLGLFEHLV